MPVFEKKIKPPAARKIEPLEPGMTYVYHWTRKEQIENAVEDGTIDEIQPPLTPEELADL